MAKRGADNYLTDRNWDDETEAEEVRVVSRGACVVGYL